MAKTGRKVWCDRDVRVEAQSLCWSFGWSPTIIIILLLQLNCKNQGMMERGFTQSPSTWLLLMKIMLLHTLKERKAATATQIVGVVTPPWRMENEEKEEPIG